MGFHKTCYKFIIINCLSPFASQFFKFKLIFKIISFALFYTNINELIVLQHMIFYLFINKTDVIWLIKSLDQISGFA